MTHIYLKQRSSIYSINIWKKLHKNLRINRDVYTLENSGEEDRPMPIMVEGRESKNLQNVAFMISLENDKAEQKFSLWEKKAPVQSMLPWWLSQ